MKKTLVALLVGAVLLGSGCIEEAPKPQCLKGHMEKRHKDAHTSMTYNAALKMAQPVSHPAKDWEEFVCDDYYGVPTSSPKASTSTPLVLPPPPTTSAFELTDGEQYCRELSDVRQIDNITSTPKGGCQVIITDKTEKVWCINAVRICEE